MYWQLKTTFHPTVTKTLLHRERNFISIRIGTNHTHSQTKNYTFQKGLQSTVFDVDYTFFLLNFKAKSFQKFGSKCAYCEPLQFQCRG